MRFWRYLEAPNVCFGRRFYKRRRPPRLFFERALWREKRAHCCENVRFVMQTTTFLQSAPPCIWNMPFAANGVQSTTLDPLGSDFPSKNPFKKCFKIVFFSLWRRDPVLELQFPTPLRIVLLCFATQPLQIAL